MSGTRIPRLKECNGFLCGQVIKKGSISVDRIVENELKEFIQDLFESSVNINAEWLIDVFKKFFQNQVDEEWFKELICSVDCGSGGGDLKVNPELIKFPAEGGRQTVTVETDATTSWYVKN